MPLRIGILTFHRCINYGSYWQARALVSGLRAAGHDAVLLDHHSQQVNRAEWRCAFQPLLPARLPRSEFRLYAAKARRVLDALRALPLSRRFRLERPETMEPFDLVVIGSDEVWNLHHPWYGGWPIFYGQDVRADRIVSYAASFGNYDAGQGLDSWRAERLRGFASLSVRDSNSRRLVAEATGVEPALVLDPCLQFADSIVADEADETGEERPFVAVYGHSFPAWFEQSVRGWADARRYPLVSVGYHNQWADEQRIDAGPEDFARLIARSAAVATNFFHGCVFALIKGRPFACAASPYRSNKVLDLTRLVGAERHVVDDRSPPADYAEALDAPPSGAIGERIAALRARSGRFLAHALA